MVHEYSRTCFLRCITTATETRPLAPASRLVREAVEGDPAAPVAEVLRVSDVHLGVDHGRKNGPLLRMQRLGQLKKRRCMQYSTTFGEADNR